MWGHEWRKRIGVHLYCNITPISALKTPDQVTLFRIHGVVSWGSPKLLHQKSRDQLESLSKSYFHVGGRVETDGASVLRAFLQSMS